MSFEVISVCGEVYLAVNIEDDSEYYFMTSDDKNKTYLMILPADITVLVLDSVEYWYGISLPPHYKTAKQIMSEVSFKNIDSVDETETMGIPLGKRGYIKRQCGESGLLPLEHVVRWLMKYLSKNKYLVTQKLDSAKRTELGKRWQAAIEDSTRYNRQRMRVLNKPTKPCVLKASPETEKPKFQIIKGSEFA